MGVVLKRTEMFCFGDALVYAPSPWIHLTNWISLGIMVTLFSWMAYNWTGQPNKLQMLPADTSWPQTEIAGLSWSLERFPSWASGKATYEWGVLCSSGSGNCLWEPWFLSCNGVARPVCHPTLHCVWLQAASVSSQGYKNQGRFFPWGMTHREEASFRCNWTSVSRVWHPDCAPHPPWGGHAYIRPCIDEDLWVNQ